MSVIRVAKIRGYTVMSNYHLRDKELSCKACGRLSRMLSLPEEWDYTTQGLDRKSTRLNSSHSRASRMPSSA